MYERLTELIQTGNIKDAMYELQDELLYIDDKDGDSVAKLRVLEATIWELQNDRISEFDALAGAMRYNQSDYEIFYMLGLFYLDTNIDKAFLCFERAFFYCDDENDRAAISEQLESLRKEPALRVRNVSIMILSYNDLDILKKCIEAIERLESPDTVQIVVVDNCSTEDGVLQYLREKKANTKFDFKLIESPENLGFPKGCNLGAKECDEDNDIFFLNNDAILTENALFWLRMGLYDDRGVGATGAMSNSASMQVVDTEGEEFEEYAGKHSIPLLHPYIKRFRLTGFALLVSRDALKIVASDGKVFDELYSPGYFEDDDLGIRMARAGFKQYLCKNSFIYHKGGSGFDGHNDAMERGREHFSAKWGFDIWKYCLQWDEAVDRLIVLCRESARPLRVLDFTCGFGANASYVKGLFPETWFAGVCEAPFEAGIAKTIVDDVCCGSLNLARLPWKSHSFDVVIADKETVSKWRATQYLAPGGKLLGNFDDDFFMQSDTATQLQMNNMDNSVAAIRLNDEEGDGE